MFIGSGHEKFLRMATKDSWSFDSDIVGNLSATAEALDSC